MTNSYKTIKAATAAWKSKDWEFHRNYYVAPKSAAICKEGKRYFIVFHANCVAYREKLNQLVKYLN